jgi:hypothetical protein
MATEEAARLGAARPLAVAYALLGCFFLAERLLPQGPDAASLEAGTTDQGTTRAIGRAFGQSLFALAVAPLLNRWRLGQLMAPRMEWGGIAAMVAGLTVRLWAARVLGAFYAGTLRTSTRQSLVEPRLRNRSSRVGAHLEQAPQVMPLPRSNAAAVARSW